MKKRQWIISGVLTLFVLLIGAAMFQNFKNQKQSTILGEQPPVPVREVETVAVENKTMASRIAIDGRLTAYEKIGISAEVTGRLLPTDKNLKNGSSFSKGDLLFQIDNKDELYSLYAQRSTLLNSITLLMPDLKFDYPESFDHWKAYLDGFQIEKPVKALPEALSEKEKYYISGKNIYNQYYAIKAQEDRMKHFSILAPFDGVILSLTAYPGALVTPGMVLGQLMNTSHYEMTAPVTLDNLNYISPGQSVELVAHDLNRMWTGKVSRIGRQIDQATQSIPLYITVSGIGLKDGLFVEGTLRGASLENVSVIPRRLLLDQDKVFIYKGGQITTKGVVIVSRVEEDLIVRGLEDGDQMVISTITNLYEGQNVVVKNMKS